MSSEVIYTEGEYSIHRRNGLTDEARYVLENAPLGTEGVVYEHLNRDEHIVHLHNPVLLSIQEGDKILGTAVFCQTAVNVGPRIFNACYVRYFAASGEIRGKGIMKHFSGKTMEAIRLGESQKTIYFASVERKNHRSFKVVSGAGYENLGVMRTNGFSRFFRANRLHWREYQLNNSVRKCLGCSANSIRIMHWCISTPYFCTTTTMLSGTRAGLWQVVSFTGLNGQSEVCRA